ncbi:class I SAM-dependent RNA methyltransferase [Altererythrobacter arenosus]|uniref:Class I SAM-dependent RNA methyltransferase n=1 Tax=Altererythrobacter arenosus TaxID=3032592 RepID=A0ABY8FQA9_9SPHN|nr:class I SAM-dependent RNA methyltransferase [Altererythrobacter sp. CAU 1644]WFL77198.1 class I SAM-dependent RNA methyltransferase [Altererythrobacter sp. CAU 1644]
MSSTGTIIRIAAKGDGVTADGRHVAGAAPGDIVREDGSLEPGPHHATPPCRHFANCGGCQLQHVDDEALRQFVTDRVVNAAEGQGVAIGQLLDTHLSPPRSRRRATLHAMKAGKGAVVGFRESGSHRIVDLAECHVIAPELFALVEPLRQFVAKHGGKGAVDIELALVDQGVDCSLKNLALEGLAATEAALEFAQDNGLARLTLDQGYGPEAMWEPEQLSVTFAGVPVPFPSSSFLQATRDAEELMVADAKRTLEGAKTIADLFAGLGTFAFHLAGPAKVLAAEAARDAHLACKTAAGISGKPVHALHRDLFRNPLMADEISRFDAVLLDPPRAGAKDQIGRIAESSIGRVAYVSCNPSSWARDAKRLVDAGFKLEQLRPVGQFRWSTHVELTSYFAR